MGPVMYRYIHPQVARRLWAQYKRASFCPYFRPAMMTIKLFSAALALFLATCIHTNAAISLPVVDLGYEFHQAFSFNETTGLYNFSNIRYAAPPLGNLRFRAPMPPRVNRSRVQTGVVGRVCPQATPIWSKFIMPHFLKSYFTNSTFSAPVDVYAYSDTPSQDPRISEDCLFLDVVVPQKVFNRAQCKTPVPKEKLAPVIVYFYGGGYVLGDKSVSDPSGLIQRSQRGGNDGVIFVALNYRLGAFGWLAGHTVSRKGTPNAALHDQRLALTWVVQHIHLFGGNPDRITVLGVSAGAGSILHQLTAYKGLQGPSLFQQAILQSPAWEPNFNTNKQEKVFCQFLKFLNVSTIEEARQLPAEKLIAANAYQVSKSLYGSFTYGPVVDGIFVPDLPSQLLLHGDFDHNVKILNGHTTNEALMYTPPSSMQDNGLFTLLDGHFPEMTQEMKEAMANILYPPILDGNHGYRSWVERVSLVLSDICFQCNSYYVNHAYENNSFSYLFSIPPAIHWLDQPYTFYIKGQKSAVELPLFQVANETLAYILQDYLTSFARTGKPSSPHGPAFNIYGPESRVLAMGMNNITEMRLFNLRDISNGTLRPGNVYRSGTLAMISDEGKTTLHNLEPTDFKPEDQGVSGFMKMFTCIMEISTPIFRNVLLHVRDCPEKPFLSHCPAGRDRTGVLVALILLLVDAPSDDIVHGFVLSRVGFEPARKMLVAAFPTYSGAVTPENAGLLGLLSVRPAAMVAFFGCGGAVFWGVRGLATTHHWVQGSMNKPFTSIITLYMSQQLALELAVREIVSVVNEVYYGGDSDLDEYLKDIWSTIIHTSRKVPRENPHSPPDVPTTLQLRLAALLLTLKRQPDPAPMPTTHLGSPVNARRDLSWRQLPLLEETVHEALDDEPGRRAGFTQVETKGWVNFMAFLALITKERIVEFENIGVGVLRWALEERHDSSAGVNGWSKVDEATRLNVFIAAASIWAVVMGEELWERRGEKAESPVGLSLKPAPEPHIGQISKRRWEMWIDRLQFLSLREDLDICTRELAAEAAAVMSRVL
ncbi:hypothetical protein BBP40_006065 [Aspergillus hancockii]|nr:hypothetical protein BBP40_006065 [Aspergillus hancockii]